MKVHCTCGREFAAEFTPTNHYSARCPYCGTLTVRNAYQQTASTAMPHPVKSEAERIAGRVRRISIICNILWLIVGAGQIISVCSTWIVAGFGPLTALAGTAAIGVWNIVNALDGLRNAKNIQVGNANVIPYFEGQRNGLLATAVVNFVLGGVIGVVLILAEWYNRRYALSHRYVFETR